MLPGSQENGFDWKRNSGAALVRTEPGAQADGGPGTWLSPGTCWRMSTACCCLCWDSTRS